MSNRVNPIGKGQLGSFRIFCFEKKCENIMSNAIVTFDVFSN